MLAAAACCILHICMFYVSMHILHLRRCHVFANASSFSLSFFASFPASRSFRVLQLLLLPLFPSCVYPRASFLLIKSRPLLSISSLSLSHLSYLFFSSTRASRGMSGFNKLGKANARTEKGEPRGKARYNITLVCLIDCLSR